MKFYEFHDTQLSGIVENAYHAMAIDEHRQDYMCRWNPETGRSRISSTLVCRRPLRRWRRLSGPALSDMALRWIQDKASALGLALDAVQSTPRIISANRPTLTASFSVGSMPKKIPATIAPSAPLSLEMKSSIRRCNKGARTIPTTNRKMTACRS